MSNNNNYNNNQNDQRQHSGKTGSQKLNEFIIFVLALIVAGLVAWINAPAK